MYQANAMAYGNNILGNNIMNPQQQLTWMPKPAGDPSDLACLKSLDSLLAKQVVSIQEST
jgi:hypothetical protein